jgi:hypothetical protein
MNKKCLIAFTLLALSSIGCAGGRTTIQANEARYPVSLSPTVRDADGALLKKDQTKKVGTFKDERTAWGMLYSGVKLTPTKDISKQLNRQVKAVRGDAIVNLRIRTTHCGMNFVPLLNWLPVWPGCTNVYVEGDIVRVARRREPNPKKPTPAPTKLADNP